MTGWDVDDGRGILTAGTSRELIFLPVFSLFNREGHARDFACRSQRAPLSKWRSWRAEAGSFAHASGAHSKVFSTMSKSGVLPTPQRAAETTAEGGVRAVSCQERKKNEQRR
jgi:hypothetical protein